MIFGGLIDLFALLPGLVYETGIALVIGTFLFLIGFVWYIKKKGKIPKIPRGKGKTSKGDQTLEIFIYPRGSGKTKPHAGTYTYRTGKRVKVRIKEGNWDHWLVNGVKYSKRILKLKMKMNYKVVAVFGASSSSGGGGSGGGKPRLDILKAQAKAFKQWTLTQKNPKFYQSWAYFLSWMKKKGYGGSEAEIMKNLYVTKRDIVHAVRKYIK